MVGRINILWMRTPQAPELVCTHASHTNNLMWGQHNRRRVCDWNSTMKIRCDIRDGHIGELMSSHTRIWEWVIANFMCMHVHES